MVAHGREALPCYLGQAADVVLAAVAVVSIWSATGRVLELNPIEVLKAE